MSRDEKSMEQCAIEQRDDLTNEVRLAKLLIDSTDSDDIEPDDWREIEKWLDVEVSCDNCGEAPSSHSETDDGFVCTGAEADGDEFTIRDFSDLADAAREQFDSMNYGAGLSFTVDVTLYGGGPAGGIEFECQRGRYGLEMLSARQWHQDWFQPKGWAAFDDDTAQFLWDTWGLDMMLEGA